jgi:hypothetical protein
LPEDWTDSVTTFAFEGRFPGLWLVAAGVAIAGLFTLLAWKEKRYATRPNVVWVLLGIRLVVLALVLWALAGPTDLLEEKRTRPKGFGLFADGSASMTIEDTGDGSGNVLRWRDLENSADAEPVRLRLDKALGALLGARQAIRSFAELTPTPNESIAKEEGTRLLKVAKGAVKACRNYLDSIAIGSPEFERLESGRFSTMRTIVDGEIGPKIAKLDVSALGSKGAAFVELEAVFAEADKSLRFLADTLYSRQEEAIGDALAKGTQTSPGSARRRLDDVVPWLDALEREWIEPRKDKMRVDRFGFDAEATPVGSTDWRKRLLDNPAPAKNGTDLGSAFGRVAQEAAAGRLHVALVVTDGAHNAGKDPREMAPALSGVPLVIVPAGDSRLRRDVFLHHVKYPKSVMKKDFFGVEAMISANDCEDEKIEVVLLAEGKEVDTTTVTIRGPMEEHRVNLKWRAMELGTHEFELRAKPVVDEFSEENNVEKIRVRTVDDEMRVFLADDLPRWEFRYLLSLFKRDKKVISESAVFSPDHNHPRRTKRPPAPSLPATAEEWSRFRVVIIGDLNQKQLTEENQELLKEYVINGGNLVVIAGENAMPQQYFGSEFGDLLPVEYSPLARGASDTGFTFAVTLEGRDTPPVQLESTGSASAKLWKKISESVPVYDLSPFSVPKPTANVLIEAKPVGRSRGERRSFLSWQYVGRGRVVYISAPAIHKLRYRHGDRYHYRFWGQMVRWIVARDLAGGSKTVKLTTDKTRYASGAVVQAKLRLNRLEGRPVSRAKVELIARTEDRIVSRIKMQPDRSAPGEYHADLTGLPSGNIKLEPTGPGIDTLLRREKYTGPVGAEIAIDPHDSAELRQPLCNMSLLRSIADASGGVLLSPAAATEFLSHLDLEPKFEERSEREPIWASWWLIFAICVLLLGEWIGRKVIGLV